MTRPRIEDARDKMYRVRVNNEEESMLRYVCNKKELKNRSEVFRAALKELYGLLRRREFDMNENQNDYYVDNEEFEEYDEKISLVRIIDCPYCSTKNKIDLQVECEKTSKERQMGPEIIYMFDTKENCCIKCGRPFRILGYISEYPMGAYNSEEIKVVPIEDEEN